MIRATTIAIAIMALATAAEGQRAAPRVAGIAPSPAPPPPPRNTGWTGAPDYRYVETYRPVAVGVVPVAVLGDGRIFADFGRGYEQVLRSCAASGGHTRSYSTVTQRGTVSSTAPRPVPTYAPPVYTAPVYSAPVYPVPGSSVSSYTPQRPQTTSTAACWTTDASGRVIVVRQ